MLKDARQRRVTELKSERGFVAYQKYLKQRREKSRSLPRNDSLDSTDKRYHQYKRRAKESDSIFDFAQHDSIYKDTLDQRKDSTPQLTDVYGSSRVQTYDERDKSNKLKGRNYEKGAHML